MLYRYWADEYACVKGRDKLFYVMLAVCDMQGGLYLLYQNLL